MSKILRIRHLEEEIMQWVAQEVTVKEKVVHSYKTIKAFTYHQCLSPLLNKIVKERATTQPAKIKRAAPQRKNWKVEITVHQIPIRLVLVSNRYKISNSISKISKDKEPRYLIKELVTIQIDFSKEDKFKQELPKWKLRTQNK
jgi:hypothetical protein